MDRRLREDSEQWISLIRRECATICSVTNTILAESGMNRSQFNALLFIAEGRDVTMGAIAKELRVTMGAGTNLIDKLVANSIVSRHRTERDRRIVTVRLTDEGKRRLDECSGKLLDYWAVYLEKIEPDVRKTWLAALQQLTDMMSEADLRGNVCVETARPHAVHEVQQG